MNSKERCLAVLKGQKPDIIPVVPQGFLFAIEQAGYKMKDVVFNGRKMADAQCKSWQKFGYDGCVIDFDDATIAEACGAKAIFREEEPTIVNEENPVLKRLEDIEDLELPTPESGRLPVWLEATSELVRMTENQVMVMGRADQGSFALACLLRGTQQFMMDVMTEPPEKIHKVLEYCTKASVMFAKAQKDAGARITSIGDALAGPNLISPEMYHDLVVSYHLELTREIQEYGIPLSIHICGNTTNIIDDMASTGCSVLELDWQVDFGEISKKVTNVLMGNINPSDPMVFGTPEKVKQQVLKLLEVTRGKGLFVSTGCAMGRNTKPENLTAMIDAVKEYKL